MVPTADVIVVLGAGVLPSGKPTPTLERRTQYGIELFRAGSAPMLLFSGGIGKRGFSEARVMRELAITEGVPGDRILIDEHSTTTFESAIACARIMNGQCLRRAIVVTDSYHLFRAILAFRHLGVEVEGKSPPSDRGETARRRWVYYHLREIVAIPWYLLKLARWTRSGDRVKPRA
ncbi:MAG: YdcF family protein [Chlorobiaceae bacterium]|jgi:uncharacterized SAM-binding protein YcdF (DUF218 family)